MGTTLSVMESVAVMITMILLVVMLKRIHILKADQSLMFSKLVLNVTLPAVIFASLATQKFHDEFLQMAVIMAVIELSVVVIAYLIGTALRFERGVKGALILVSAFGMTSMLGYPIIMQVFPGSELALEEAVITSEFGVGFLLFILGPFIAMYFGESQVKGNAIVASTKKFFLSPIFLSLVVGYGVSLLGITSDNPIFSTVIRFFKLVGSANIFLVAITIGLILDFRKIDKIVLFLGIAMALKLLVKPLMAIFLTQSPHFTNMMSEIVVIETALPSAILTAVFAKQYNCRPDLVSVAIMVSLVFSVFTLSLLFWVFL